MCICNIQDTTSITTQGKKIFKKNVRFCSFSFFQGLLEFFSISRNMWSILQSSCIWLEGEKKKNINLYLEISTEKFSDQFLFVSFSAHWEDSGFSFHLFHSLRLVLAWIYEIVVYWYFLDPCTSNFVWLISIIHPFGRFLSSNIKINVYDNDRRDKLF